MKCDNWSIRTMTSTMLIVLTIVCSLAWSTNAAVAQVETFTRWEHSLTSARDYNNPYADVKVRVVYTGPQGQTLDTFAFWDGGDTFKIRANFPAPGQWTWHTSSSDPKNKGLHDQSGTVNVVEYSGENLLYRRGTLTVSDNQRYLTYSDGTPFLWTGDTAWIIPMKATAEQWHTYVQDRVAKDFSVIQISPASAWGGSHDAGGNEPFIGKGIAKWNPAYWQGYEQKVQYANEQGLVVMVVGVMEPTFRYPRTAPAKLFARNFAARLAGNQVVFSPSFDSGSTPEQIELANAVGRVLDEAVLNQLVTQHPGTTMKPVKAWHDEPYVDFVGVQSGHNRRNYQRVFGHAIHWVLNTYRMKPTRPVINLEALYAADSSYQNDEKHVTGSAADARHTAYLSILSGATSGITYGAQGVWYWETDKSKPAYWRKAIEYPSSTQIGYLHDFFSGIEWWQLEPALDLVLSNEPIDDNRYLSAFAMSSEGDLGVAYIPPGRTNVTLDMSKFANDVSVRWFNPQTGGYKDIEGSVANSGSHQFTRPTGSKWNDAVLLLRTNS